MNKRQVQVTLLGAAAGYLFSEYVILRRLKRDGAAIYQKAVDESKKERARIKWAQERVVDEVKRGKYDGRGLDPLREDFYFYKQVAPDAPES